MEVYKREGKIEGKGREGERGGREGEDTCVVFKLIVSITGDSSSQR